MPASAARRIYCKNLQSPSPCAQLEPTSHSSIAIKGDCLELALSMSDATASTIGQAPVVTSVRQVRPSPAALLAKRLGLRIANSEELVIRRRRRGKGWSYIGADGQVIDDLATIKRLAALAVPPAYQDVLYAADPSAHL